MLFSLGLSFPHNFVFCVDAVSVFSFHCFLLFASLFYDDNCGSIGDITIPVRSSRV